MRIHVKAALCALLICGATLQVRADSSAASSVSDSITTSVGSISGSIENSSRSSSNTTHVAEGDYRLIEVVDVKERAGMVRLELQAQSTHADSFYVYLPQAAFVKADLRRGDTVSARQRPYGLALAKADMEQPFFLLLTDEWLRELPSRAVML